MVRRDAKRVLDLALAIPLAVLTLPIQGVVAVAVARKLGRPVLFRQERPGLHGKSFTMNKFRTMLPVDADRGLVDDESRMTDLGTWLRSTSLDELPTLWNVIIGDMSIVGPRPLLMHYLERYTVFQARRHEVKPGITGLAQVSGRNDLSWDERLRFDVAYVDRHSTLIDLLIVARTVKAVLTRRGIAAAGSATMPEFHPMVESTER